MSCRSGELRYEVRGRRAHPDVAEDLRQAIRGPGDAIRMGRSTSSGP